MPAGFLQHAIVFSVYFSKGNNNRLVAFGRIQSDKYSNVTPVGSDTF